MLWRQRRRQRRRRDERTDRHTRLRPVAAPHGPASRVPLPQEALNLILPSCNSMRSRAVAVALVTLATFTDLVAYSVCVPVLPDLARRLGASATLIGLLFASFGVTLVAVGVPMGVVSDR